MNKTNLGRVILGGIVAGIVANILGYIVDGVLLAPQWNAAMQALGKAELSTNQIMAMIIIGLAYGIFAIWLYAALRARYGAGPKAAVTAGLAVWVAGVLLPNAGFMGVTGFFPMNLTIMTTAAGIVEWVAGTLAGAALYKDAAPSMQSMAARA
jgi:hypothetical protein